MTAVSGIGHSSHLIAADGERVVSDLPDGLDGRAGEQILQGAGAAVADMQASYRRYD